MTALSRVRASETRRQAPPTGWLARLGCCCRSTAPHSNFIAFGGTVCEGWSRVRSMVRQHMLDFAQDSLLCDRRVRLEQVDDRPCAHPCRAAGVRMGSNVQFEVGWCWK